TRLYRPADDKLCIRRVVVFVQQEDYAMSNRMTSLSVAAALAGAVSLAALSSPKAAETLTGLEKCYGISKAGQNSCANATGTHSGAGEGPRVFDGGEGGVVKAGGCTELGGKLQASRGVAAPKDVIKKN